MFLLARSFAALILVVDSNRGERGSKGAVRHEAAPHGSVCSVHKAVLLVVARRRIIGVDVGACLDRHQTMIQTKQS